MELQRKEIEQLLASLKPTGLSDHTLNRLESAMAADISLDASLLAVESLLAARSPRALKPEIFESLLQTAASVPFVVDEKVVMFPGARKEQTSVEPRKAAPVRRLLAVAAVATIGGIAALLMPQQPGVSAPVKVAGTSSAKRPGVVVASYGSGIENVEDSGVVWSPDRRANRVLRFQYQDRALVRGADGVERMLLVPREEVFVVPVKVD